MSLTEKYPHLKFAKNWELTQEILLLLGECDGLVKAIYGMPMLPEYFNELYNLMLVKGAQATTAIEGNTLTTEEIEEINEGKPLPPSKSYQEQEVKNILEAMERLHKEIIGKEDAQIITPAFICRLHALVGKNLGETFESAPGKLRERNVTVGKYSAPDYTDVAELMDEFCKWLRNEFHYEQGQRFHDFVLQAIVSHVYIELIHPFSDGNGRTGRLLEFYILLRGGNPDIASDILSNHYNLTRPEYYFHLDKASEKRSLTDFIKYALTGYRDGLIEKLKRIQQSALKVTWERHIYDSIERADITSTTTRRRRRHLMLDLPLDKWLTIDELIWVSQRVARDYAQVNLRTVQRDVEDLLALKLLEKDNDKKYRANLGIVSQYMAMKKGDGQVS